jgi:hypothetical protein
MSSKKNTPMKPTDLKVDDIKYSPLKSYSSGKGGTVFLNINDGPIHVQVPELEIPFDSGTYYPSESDGFGKYNIKCSMKGHQSDEKVKGFHDMLQKLDEKIMDDAMKNSQAWFKKKTLTPEVIESLYTPLVKVSRDSETGEPNGKYAPTFGFKINKRNGQVQCKCFTMDKQVMNTDDSECSEYVDLEKSFRKGTRVKMLISCNGIWIVNGKFGCTWKAEQIRINPPVGFDDFSIMDDSDEEESVERLDKIETNFVNDSDDSEDSEEEEKEEEKQPKKRVVRKKKSSN